jgi:DNA-binding GntR family transcriptional regulator
MAPGAVYSIAELASAIGATRGATKEALRRMTNKGSTTRISPGRFTLSDL